MNLQFQLDQHKTSVPINENTSNLASLNVGKWTTQENVKYTIFMDFHKVTLSSRHKKKNFKVFQQMAVFIGSRNTIQCRSHHQKLEERFKHFKKIIAAVKNQIGRRDYRLQYKKWTNNGSALVIESSKIKEKLEVFKQSTQKETVKPEEMVQQVKIKLEEPICPQTIYPFLAYPSFHGGFGFPMAGIYPFTVPYFG